MENTLNLVLTGVISLCLITLSMLMYMIYRRFTKGDFKTICLWTTIILISVAFHEGVMFVHPLIDESVGMAHSKLDTAADWLLSLSFIFIIISGIMLIKNFNEFSKRFGLLGKINAKESMDKAHKSTTQTNQ